MSRSSEAAGKRQAQCIRLNRDSAPWGREFRRSAEQHLVREVRGQNGLPILRPMPQQRHRHVACSTAEVQDVRLGPAEHRAKTAGGSRHQSRSIFRKASDSAGRSAGRPGRTSPAPRWRRSLVTGPFGLGSWRMTRLLTMSRRAGESDSRSRAITSASVTSSVTTALPMPLSRTKRRTPARFFLSLAPAFSRCFELERRQGGRVEREDEASMRSPPRASTTCACC